MSEQSGILANLEGKLNLYLVEKAPFQLPENVKEILVKIAPWLSLIVFVITLPSFLIIFGVGSFFSTFNTYIVGYSTMFYVSTVFVGIQLLMLGLSIPGLFGRKRSAWNLLFYSELISILAGVFSWLNWPGHIGSLIGTAISALIGLYLIFQLRSYYTN
jgi:Na+/melibiose symporter-like transporter